MSTNPSRAPLSAADEAVENTPRLVRRLGAHERLMHYYSAAHPRHFCVVAELAGNGRIRDYRAAFAMIQRRHPMLSVFVGEDAEGPGFYHAERPIEVTLIPRFKETDWHRVVERELASAFPDDKGPLLRVTVLENDGDDVVVLTFHHAAADAMSGVYVIQDLMEMLDGRALSALPVLPPVEALAAQALLPAGETLAVTPQTEEEIEALRAVARAPLWRPFEGDSPLVSSIRFDPQATDCVLRACRARKTTLHGALCAALVVTTGVVTAGEAGKETYTITSPFNLRSMLGVETRDCGILVSVAPVRFPLQAEPNFWQLARQACDELKPARTPETVLAGLSRLESRIPPQADSALAAGQIGSMQYDAVISNLGALPIPTRVGSVKLEAFWGPFVQGRFSNERVIGAASISDQLHLTQTTPRHIPSFLEDLSRNLVEACLTVLGTEA